MRKTNPVLPLAAAALAGMVWGQAARAVDLTWTGDDATAGGPGTWIDDGATTNWLNGATPVPWSSGNVAVFPAPPGTVTVGGPIAGVDGLRFTGTTAGYTLNGGTLNFINTLAAAGTRNIEVADDAAAATDVSINSVVAGGNGFLSIAKTGAGTAVLSGNNTFTVNSGLSTVGVIVTTGTLVLTGNNAGVVGQFTPNGGTIAVGTDTAMGTANRVRTVGGTLRSADAGTRTLGNFFDIAASVTLGSSTTGNLVLTNEVATGGGAKTLTINNATTTISGIVSGSGANNTTKAGPGTLVFSGANTYDRPTAITAGTLSVVGSGRIGSATNARPIIVADAGLLDLQAAGLSPNATLDVTSSDATAEVSLGVSETISVLLVNGVALTPGTYGSNASGAANTGLANPNDVFSGTGILTVTSIPEPASLGLSAVAAIGLLARRRRRPVAP